MVDLPRAYVRAIRASRRLRDRVLGPREAPDPDPVNGFEVLEKVAQLPISSWSYSWDPEVRHLGPMAQDFHSAFGLGDSDRRIWGVDSAGVSLVAIQALYRKVKSLETEVEALRADRRHGDRPDVQSRTEGEA